MAGLADAGDLDADIGFGGQFLQRLAPGGQARFATVFRHAGVVQNNRNVRKIPGQGGGLAQVPIAGL